MSETGRPVKVSVTITQQGVVRDVVVGDVSIGSVIRSDAAHMSLSADDLPQLSIVLIPDEVIVKGPGE